MKEIGIGKKRLQHNIVDLFSGIPTDPDRWSLHGERTYAHTHTHKHTHTHTHTHTHESNYCLRYVVTLCYNAWVAMDIIFVRNTGGKTSKIKWIFESNLRSFSFFKCFIWLLLEAFLPDPVRGLQRLLNPSCKGNSVKIVGLSLWYQILFWCQK